LQNQQALVPENMESLRHAADAIIAADDGVLHPKSKTNITAKRHSRTGPHSVS
jgi:hypothetical protein